MTSPTPDAGVRTARAGDADAIGQVHARSWGASYGALLPAQVARVLAPESLADSWRAAITDPPSAQHRVLVATAGPDIVGFVALAPGGDVDAETGRDAELLVLLVDPDQQRHGHGSRLLNAAADTLRENGFGLLRAWVPEADSDRQSFFVEAGFLADGAGRLLDAAGDGTTTVREVRLSAALQA